MSKKTNSTTTSPELSPEQRSAELLELSHNLLEKTKRLTELEERLKRLEKRYKSNERLAQTLATCLSTQVVAIDAVSEVTRRTITGDAATHDVLQAAIKAYDKHKVRRWLSGFCGVLLWICSVAAAACTGAFIYWLFCK